MSPPSSIRLNKYLALHTGVSRREADLLIEKGRVTVNGHGVILGAQISLNDSIAINGKQLHATATHQYLLFHKPIGYVCSRKAQGDHPTIYSLLPKKYHHLKPVGRLDRDSSGIMLLTNDGDTAYKMTHPKFAKIKIYIVQLDHDLAPLHQQMISDVGIDLEDGKSRLHLERISEQQRRSWHITMHEGRNRQIRRTFGALGYTVTQLQRIQFGPYQLNDMQPGDYQEQP